MSRIVMWARKAVDLAAGVAHWVEVNMAALTSAGSLAGAVYTGITEGADAKTLLLAVGALLAALQHIKSTPLSRPRASDGTPLVPVTDEDADTAAVDAELAAANPDGIEAEKAAASP